MSSSPRLSSQRRSSSSSGKGDETSDLLDMKALAARARAQTGSHPGLPQNPAELSGVRPRRDSVIGARLTPPPRATSSQLPNWFWGVLGCLSVLLVGLLNYVPALALGPVAEHFMLGSIR